MIGYDILYKIEKEGFDMSKKRLPLMLVMIMSIVLVYGAPVKAKEASTKVIRGASTRNQAVKKYFKTLNDFDGKGFIRITCPVGLEKSLDKLVSGINNSYKEYIQEYMDEHLYTYKNIKKGKYKRISKKLKKKYTKMLNNLPKAPNRKINLKNAYSVRIRYKCKSSFETGWQRYESVLILYKKSGRWYVLDID